MSVTELTYIVLAWLVAVAYIAVFVSAFAAFLFTAIFVVIICAVVLMRHFRKY